MSTELNSIKGKIEVPIPHKLHSEYKTAFLEITSFSGGKERGHSLQLNINSEHIQLDNEGVRELIKELVKEYL